MVTCLPLMAQSRSLSLSFAKILAPGSSGCRADPIPGKVFPMGYFLDACRAVNFIRKDIRLDEVVTVKGIEHTIVK